MTTLCRKSRFSRTFDDTDATHGTGAVTTRDLDADAPLVTTWRGNASSSLDSATSMAFSVGRDRRELSRRLVHFCGIASLIGRSVARPNGPSSPKNPLAGRRWAALGNRP
jgi:hypothetical protein